MARGIFDKCISKLYLLINIDFLKIGENKILKPGRFKINWFKKFTNSDDPVRPLLRQ